MAAAAMAATMAETLAPDVGQLLAGAAAVTAGTGPGATGNASVDVAMAQAALESSG